MKTLHVLLTCATVAGVALVATAAASGQYYTPLRYDLRYTSPTYIPGGTLRFGPTARRDPYAFGSPQYGNLSITGNLRLGKSFRGTSPYRPLGSQLSANLPSLGLSDFRRDSIGLEDIGTGLEYGQTGAYFPGSASVTTPYTAGSRFATPLPGDRAPYVPRNVNAPSLPPRYAPWGVFTPGYAQPGTAPGTVGLMTAGGLAIPQSALDFVDALIDGRASPMPAHVTEPPESTQVKDRFKLPYEMFGHRFESSPTNIFIPQEEVEEHAGDMTVPEAPSSLFWMDRDAAGARGLYVPDRGDTSPATPSPTRSSPAGDEEIWPDEPSEAQNLIPAAPAPYMPVSTYAAYVIRGHAAMKEPVYDKAEALYAAAAALEPDRPAAFFGRVHALMGGRLYRQTIVVLERGLKRRPEWVKAAPDIKGVYPKPDVYDRIVADLERELQPKPTHVGYNFLLGYVYYAAGDRAAARPYLRKVALARDNEPGPEKTILSVIDGG